MFIHLDEQQERNLRILVDRYTKAKIDPNTSKEKLARNTKELADLCEAILVPQFA